MNWLQLSIAIQALERGGYGGLSLDGPCIVMTGLDPAIHATSKDLGFLPLDGPIKSGHDNRIQLRLDATCFSFAFVGACFIPAASAC
jgi:hypothetical protein